MQKKDKELINTHDYSKIKFPVSKKYFRKIKMKKKICTNVFCYKNKLTYPVYISDQKFENPINFLLISNHYVYIKDFDRFMFNKTKKIKSTFVGIVGSVLAVKMY